MHTTITQTQVKLQEATDSVDSFFKTYGITKLLRECRAHKAKGYPATVIFRYLVCLMFSPVSTYMAMQVHSYREDFSKNTIYRFCNDNAIN